jgi:hypothetical protein
MGLDVLDVVNHGLGCRDICSIALDVMQKYEGYETASSSHDINLFYLFGCIDPFSGAIPRI